MFLLLILYMLLCFQEAIVGAAICQDIDTSACVTMALNKPDLCSDKSLAMTACPKYCNLCPITCYHCNTTVRNINDCQTTKRCKEGQACMRKELRSIFDGHQEYELTCADKQACDGPFAGALIGKRHIAPRDLTVSCCLNDLCNIPPPPTAPQSPGCVRDFVIALDESSRTKHFNGDIKQFLLRLVDSLPVSQTEVHVALGLFTDSARSIFALDELTSKNETLSRISQLVLQGGHDADSVYGLNYVLETALTQPTGDRPEASNVVLFITSHQSGHRAWMYKNEHDLHQKAEVISLDLGGEVLQHAATDDRHDFDVTSDNELQSLIPIFRDFICKK